MTRTEYREYIAGESWRRRRAEFLKDVDGCERCEAPRQLVILVYDQDLHVHHRSYARIGNERPEDLEALCRRCHEIETFGRSELREIKPYARCEYCKEPVWDYACSHGIEALCADCTLLMHGISPRKITSERLEVNAEGKIEPGIEFWKHVLGQITWMIHKDDVRKALELAIEGWEKNDPSCWRAFRESPSREGFVRRIYDKYKADPGATALEEIAAEGEPVNQTVN
jgi:hypothetical protein